MKNQDRLSYLESEKQSLEHVLERTSTLYRQAMLERHQMTKTWRAAVESLNARDITIRKVLEVIRIQLFHLIEKFDKIRKNEIKSFYSTECYQSQGFK